MCGKLKGAASHYTWHGYRSQTRRWQQNTLSHASLTGLALRLITRHGTREAKIGGEFGGDNARWTLRNRYIHSTYSPLRVTARSLNHLTRSWRTPVSLTIVVTVTTIPVTYLDDSPSGFIQCVRVS
jgi:hypothetical protein